MSRIVADLGQFRGPGERKVLWRSLLFAGFRFSATNLQDGQAPLPRTVTLSTGVFLDGTVQRRLADHVCGGGSLLMIGKLPQRDTEDRTCTVLADALGLRPGEPVFGNESYYPSLVGRGLAEGLPETRAGWLAGVEGVGSSPLFTDVEGRTCGVTVEVGSGRAVVLTCEVASSPGLFTTLVEWLGSRPGLRLRTDVPGVVVTTGAGSRGERMLHVLNPTGYAAQVQVDVGDPTGLLDGPLLVPARTGQMLGLGLPLPGGGTIVSSNAEVVQVAPDRLRFGRGLGAQTEVWLRTDRPVHGGEIRREADLTVVSGTDLDGLVVTFG